jgi:hypothetical protein
VTSCLAANGPEAREIRFTIGLNPILDRGCERGESLLHFGTRSPQPGGHLMY